MEKSQSIQHEPTQVAGPTPELTNSKSLPITSSNIFVYLLTEHPWLLLTGLLTVFLGTAALALYNLGHVGGTEQVEPEQVPSVIKETTKTPLETSNPTPLWMIVAIALSCGSGCLIILRLLNRPRQPQKIQKKVVKPDQVPLTSASSQKWEPETFRTQPAFMPLQPLKPIAPMQVKTKPLVTVLPPEHRHPLDNSKESLADLMDLRKQNSLSAILQKY